MDSCTITLTFKDGSTLTALETANGNVDTPTTGQGHAGGTQEFTGGGRYEGATGFTHLTTSRPTTSSPGSRAGSAAQRS